MKTSYHAMKDRKEFEKWARGVVDKYRKVLLVQDHVFSIEYVEGLRNSSMMEHTNMYPYKTCHLKYGDTAMRYWKNGEKEELRQVLIHELCHDITDPLYMAGAERHITCDTLANERERLTDHIANIIIPLKV